MKRFFIERFLLQAGLMLLCALPLSAQEGPEQFKGWVYYETHHPSPHHELIRSEKALNEFRKRIPKHRPTKKKPAPAHDDPLAKEGRIDFSKYLLIVVSRDDTLSAYPVLTGVVETKEQVVVWFELPEPPPEAMPYGWGTYRAVLLPVQDKDYTVEFDN